MKKNSINEVNYMKGLAILLVFIGHAVTPTFLERPFLYEIIVQFIYGFNMTVFFIISGFLGNNSNKISNYKEFLKYFKSRCIRLGIPFITFSIITNMLVILLQAIVSKEFNFSHILNMIKTTLIYPESGVMRALWFLYTLLIISIMAPLLYKLSWKIVMPIAILLNILVPKYN